MTGAYKSLLVLLLAGSTAEAGRTDEGSVSGALTPGASAFDREIVKDTNTVCGGTAIRDLLNVDDQASLKKTVQQISSRNWKTILGTAKNFIASAGSEVTLLRDEIKSLDQRIEQKRQDEKPADLTEAEAIKVISGAVAQENAFGSLEGAVQSNCGHDAYNGKYFTSIVKLNKVAKDAFGDSLKSLGSFRMLPDDFITVCTRHLPCDDEDSEEDDSYCDELCQAFSEILVEHTEDANVGASSNELMNLRDSKKEDLKNKLTELTECESAKVTLTGFSAQLTELRNAIRDLNDERIDTQEALHAAESTLGDVQNDMNLKDKELEELTALLAESEGNVGELEEQLAEAKKNDALCTGNLDQTQKTLVKVQDTLHKANSANQMINTVKGAVSNVMFQMVLQFESAVRVPMAKIGLSWDTDIDSYFPASAAEMARATDVRGSVDLAKRYCSKVAMPAFDEIKQKVTLSSLCGMPEVATINSEIEDSVTERINEAKQALRQVQSLLHLGALVNGERAELDEANINKRAEQGEPRGLMDTLGVYGEIAFYKDYLMKWALGQDFQLRINKLSSLVSDLEKTQAVTKMALVGAVRAATEANLKHKQVATLLTKALEDKSIKAQNVEAASTALEAITAKTQQADVHLEALKAKLAELDEQLRKARETLVSTYKDGTKLIQFFESLDGART
jgi:hypothetical protein